MITNFTSEDVSSITRFYKGSIHAITCSSCTCALLKTISTAFLSLFLQGFGSVTTAITNGLGTPSPDQTCILTSTKADLVHASPAFTSTGVTGQDVQQPTPGKTMQNSPATERTDLSRLHVLTIPPEDTPKYLSHLSPPTPIDIAKLASYLQGHLDPLAVKNLISGFSQGFKIGFSGPRAPKEYSNIFCAKSNPLFIDKNVLKEVTLGIPHWGYSLETFLRMAHHIPPFLSQTPPHRH